jgi:transcriptional regulator with XRE-family HTH domain
MTTNTYRAKEALKRMGIKEPTFASLIKNHRQCEELTQLEMAKLLGVSVSHLSDIENERKFVSIERARTFAKKLKDSEKYFVLVTLRDQLRRAKCNFEIELKSKKAS